MAAPRPDVKFYLDADSHAALKAFAEHDDMSMAELTELVMGEYLRKRLHDVSVLADRLRRAGIIRDESSEAGTGRK